MPGRGTHKVIFRIPEDQWQRFGQAAGAAGTNRAAVLREVIRWYLREQGAQLPARPPQT